MHSLVRFTILLVPIAAGVGLATAVVMNSDPATRQSPAELVHSMIHSGERPPVLDARESTAPQRDRPPPEPAEAVEPPIDESPADDTGEPDTLARTSSFPSITASTVYVTPPAVAGATPFVPGATPPYQVPYYPMVANQVGPAAAQTQIDDAPSAVPEINDQLLPAPPDNKAPTPEPSPKPVVRRDEGDDSLVITIQNSDIREVLEALSEQGQLNILASKNVTGKVSASLNGVDVQTALKAILKSTGFVARHDGDFIYVGTPEDFKSMDQAQDIIGTRIYRPNYVTATELQTLILPLLTESIGESTASSPAQVDIASDNTKTGGDDFANGEVLLVRDYESVLCQVDQIVEEVDQRPLQVSIEAVILTVNLNDDYEFGVNFELLRDNDNIRIVSGTPLDNLANLSVGEGGLKVGFLDSSLAFLLEALETVGDTNVVASPKVLCLNKQRAEIHIGEQLGYITTTITETATTQTVEFLEVGTQLRLRPFISADGMIRMEIHPELSTGDVDIQQGMTIPDKAVTQVTTNIMCRDGCTVVIGGLIREDLDQETTQIPVFGSLPVIGPAFRQKVEEIRRDEIIVLITPRIVHDPCAYMEGEEAACATRDRVEVFADKMSPIGTRFYGRRFARKAQAAWAAGDADTALRCVNLAIHFDRQNNDALRLRREIAAVCPQPADNNTRVRLRRGLMPWQWPNPNYTRMGWPWRTPEPIPTDPHSVPLELLEEIPTPATVANELESTAADPSTVRPVEKPLPTPPRVPVIDPLSPSQ